MGGDVGEGDGSAAVGGGWWVRLVGRERGMRGGGEGLLVKEWGGGCWEEHVGEEQGRERRREGGTHGPAVVVGTVARNGGVEGSSVGRRGGGGEEEGMA